MLSTAIACKEPKTRILHTLCFIFRLRVCIDRQTHLTRCSHKPNEQLTSSRLTSNPYFISGSAFVSHCKSETTKPISSPTRREISTDAFFRIVIINEIVYTYDIQHFLFYLFNLLTHLFNHKIPFFNCFVLIFVCFNRFSVEKNYEKKFVELCLRSDWFKRDCILSVHPYVSAFLPKVWLCLKRDGIYLFTTRQLFRFWDYSRVYESTR